MTERDSTNRSSTTRRDLRFAGTIAAGLCAGVLGVGAIAVPLFGWNDWPQALPVSDGDPIVLTDADDRAASGGDGAARYTPRPTVSGPAGAVALVTAPDLAVAATGATGASGGTPGASGAAGTTGTAPTAGSPSGSDATRRPRAALRSVGRGSQADAVFAEGEFTQDADGDGDGLADVYEDEQGLDKSANDAAA